MTLDSAITQFPGPYRTDLVPMVRWVFDAAQNNRNKIVAVMVSAQSAKTQTLMIFACWIICEAPGPTFWVTSSEETANEFVKARLWSQFESCPEVMRRMPTLRSEVNLSLITFANMSLYFRGANSKAKLKSTPVRWLVMDEVSDWRPGMVELVRKRVRSYLNSRTMMISTAGADKDDIHSAYLRGTQTMAYWPCPACSHKQPFRFGKEVTVMFPRARQMGGMLWDTTDVTRPGGVWNYSEVKKTVRYQCEKCGAEIQERERFKLLQKLERVDHNPAPDRDCESFHWWAAYMPWVSWADIVVEFLAAVEALKHGDVEPIKSFVQETLGEPFVLRGTKPSEAELRMRCGNYRLGELWTEDKMRKTARVIGVDVQEDHLRFVQRQLRAGGDSRLIDYGRLLDFEELRAYQVKHKILDQCVWMDSGDRTSEVYRSCLTYGWIAMKGSAEDGFMEKRADKMILVPYKIRSRDPFAGTDKANKHLIRFATWSNPAYKDRFYLIQTKGKGPLWELPINIGDDYLAELQHEERMRERNTRGAMVLRWKETGPCHYADCEQMILVAADAGKFTHSEIVKAVDSTLEVE